MVQTSKIFAPFSTLARYGKCFVGRFNMLGAARILSTPDHKIGA
ncbi:MAG: hypothetical protein ACJA06_001628 [Halocynthiibacter sp.]|jgi:hypothetical protein